MIGAMSKTLVKVIEDIPYAGPAAGIVLKFFETYEEVEKTVEEFNDLCKLMEKSVGLMDRTSSMLKGSKEVTIELALKELSVTVHSATGTMKRLNKRLTSSTVVGFVTRMVLVDHDKDDIESSKVSLEN